MVDKSLSKKQGQINYSTNMNVYWFSVIPTVLICKAADKNNQVSEATEEEEEEAFISYCLQYASLLLYK